MKETKINYNLNGLEEMRQAIGNRYVARVGIINGKAGEIHDKSKYTNAQIGEVQLFGSITNHIPPRDFLVMPLQIKGREFTASLGASSIKTAFENRQYKKVFTLIGVAAEAIVQQAFDTGGFGQWPPNAPATIRAKSRGKGATSILINTGQMRAAVSSDVVGKGST